MSFLGSAHAQALLPPAPWSLLRIQREEQEPLAASRAPSQPCGQSAPPCCLGGQGSLRLPCGVTGILVSVNAPPPQAGPVSAQAGLTLQLLLLKWLISICLQEQVGAHSTLPLTAQGVLVG